MYTQQNHITYLYCFQLVYVNQAQYLIQVYNTATYGYWDWGQLEHICLTYMMIYTRNV